MLGSPALTFAKLLAIHLKNTPSEEDETYGRLLNIAKWYKDVKQSNLAQVLGGQHIIFYNVCARSSPISDGHYHGLFNTGTTWKF